MKFSTPLVVLAAGAATAEPLLRRQDDSNATDASAISAVIQNVWDNMKPFDAAILAYEGGDPSAMKSTDADLEAAVTRSITAAKALPDQTLAQAGAFQPLATAFDNYGVQFSDDLDSKNAIFAKIGLCPILLQHMTWLSDNLHDMSNITIGKLPAQVQQGIKPAVFNRFDQSLALLKACADVSTTTLSSHTSTSTAHPGTVTTTVTTKVCTACDGHFVTSTTRASPEGPCTTGAGFPVPTGGAGSGHYTPGNNGTYSGGGSSPAGGSGSGSGSGWGSGPASSVVLSSPTQVSSNNPIVTAGASAAQLPLAGAFAMALLSLLW